jgi:hypothetical protein
MMVLADLNINPCSIFLALATLFSFMPLLLIFWLFLG